MRHDAIRVRVRRRLRRDAWSRFSAHGLGRLGMPRSPSPTRANVVPAARRARRSGEACVDIRDRAEWSTRAPAKVDRAATTRRFASISARAPARARGGRIQFGSAPDSGTSGRSTRRCSPGVRQPRGVDRVTPYRPRLARRGGARGGATHRQVAHGRLAREPALRGPRRRRARAHARSEAAASARLGAARQPARRGFRARLRTRSAADGPGRPAPPTAARPLTRAARSHPYTSSRRPGRARALRLRRRVGPCPLSDSAGR